MMKTSQSFFCYRRSLPQLASEQDSAQACLSWGISKMAQDPGSDRLKHLVITDINTERYDEKVGSQHIATQLTATLKKKGTR